MPGCAGGGVHLLPISVFVLLPTTFITTYVIAVLLKHVSPGFPYISDTGTRSPESCIFGQLLNMSAVLVAATVYVRYKQIQEYNSHNTRVLKINTAALWIGWCAAFGFSLVANFQETNVLIVHLIGAVMGFGLGSVYSALQTYMSYKMAPRINSRCLAHIRLALSISIALGFISTIAFGIVSVVVTDGDQYFKDWTGNTLVWDSIAKSKFHGKDPRKWNPDDGGFTAHIISTASEWIMAAAMLFFFVTYIPDFRKITLTSPEVHLLIDQNSLSVSADYVEPGRLIGNDNMT